MCNPTSFLHLPASSLFCSQITSQPKPPIVHTMFTKSFAIRVVLVPALAASLVCGVVLDKRGQDLPLQCDHFAHRSAPACSTPDNTPAVCQTSDASPAVADCQQALDQLGSSTCQNNNGGGSFCTTLVTVSSHKIDTCGNWEDELDAGVNCGGYLQTILNSCQSTDGCIGGQF